jgi:hypothetical protein
MYEGADDEELNTADQDRIERLAVRELRRNSRNYGWRKKKN